MPLVALGAAFDFHAGVLDRPPEWVGTIGLEWAVRLFQEPRRLWHRYLVLGSHFVGLTVLSLLRPSAAEGRNEALRRADREPSQPCRWG
jgi:N-acetylglucosaminyldiphosphoundecaprenol N-acetyl-beta-D-mannosaminyltransferase